MALVGVFHLWRCRRKFVLGASFIGPVRVKHEACMSHSPNVGLRFMCLFFFSKKRTRSHQLCENVNCSEHEEK